VLPEAANEFACAPSLRLHIQLQQARMRIDRD